MKPKTISLNLRPDNNPGPRFCNRIYNLVKNYLHKNPRENLNYQTNKVNHSLILKDSLLMQMILQEFVLKFTNNLNPLQI